MRPASPTIVAVAHDDDADDEEAQDVVSDIDALTEDLVLQLQALRDTLHDASVRDLADALGDLQARVTDLLAEGAGSLGPAGEASVRAIGAAAARLERARTRLVDELAPPTAAEGALRQWTRSTPGDPRVRPADTD